MSAENLFSNLLTIAILLGLVIIVYAKMAKKTLVDIVRDIRDIGADRAEAVYDMPHTFHDIR